MRALLRNKSLNVSRLQNPSCREWKIMQRISDYLPLISSPKHWGGKYTLHWDDKILKRQKSAEMKPRILNQTSRPVVDWSLIKIFLGMTPEKRLVSNDNAIRTLMELRTACRKNRKDPIWTRFWPQTGHGPQAYFRENSDRHSEMSMIQKNIPTQPKQIVSPAPNQKINALKI